MLTIVAIDDQLLKEAKKIGKHATDNEAVTAALTEYIRLRKQVNIVAFARKIERRRKGR